MLVGNTPLVELAGIEKNLGLKAKIIAKLEFMNPGGSIKDRVAKSMLDEAEKEGKITPEIIEVAKNNPEMSVTRLKIEEEKTEDGE